MKCIKQKSLRVFKNAWFGRFARKENISAQALLEAVERAEKGLIDADLGGGVIKQRVGRPGAGKSGGYRSVVIYRQGEKAFLSSGLPRVRGATSGTTRKRSSRKQPS